MGILVPGAGIEPRPSVVNAWSPNHWTARQFPRHAFFFFFKLINLFIYFWLRWVFIDARGLSLAAASGVTLHCGVWASPCGGFSFCGAQALGSQASVVVACGFSSCGSRALERRLSSCGARRA